MSDEKIETAETKAKREVTRCGWKALVGEALKALGGHASAVDVANRLIADGKIPGTNKTARQTVSRVLQSAFHRIGRGEYALEKPQPAIPPAVEPEPTPA